MVIEKVFITTQQLSEGGFWWGLTFIFVMILSIAVLYSIFGKNGISTLLPKFKFKWKSTKIDFKKKNSEVEDRLNSIKDSQCVSSFENSVLVPVVGVFFSGKSSLIDNLKSECNTNEKLDSVLQIILSELPALTTDQTYNEETLRNYKDSSLAIVVVTQDLTNYEMNAIRWFIKNGSQVIVVLNKKDCLSLVAQTEIQNSIREKLKTLSGVLGIVAVSILPKAKFRIIQLEDGSESEEEFHPKPEVEELKKLLEQYIALRNFKTLTFK